MSSCKSTITRPASPRPIGRALGSTSPGSRLPGPWPATTLCTDQIDIPPGEKRHKIILSTRIKADVHLYTVVPHAHYLCREFRLAATLPDGTIQPLLWITDWDLDWQDQYRYAQPVRLPKGTIVTLAAYFDNSGREPAKPEQAPSPGPLRRRDQGRDVRLPPRIPARRPGGYEAYNQKSPFSL